MNLKTNLHFHSDEDPLDSLNYTLFEGIDRASELDFDVLAVTWHDKVINNPEYHEYAESKGVLLISGTELTVQKRHVLLINADKGAEEINTFEELAEYKEKKDDLFIIAPHPYYIAMSLGSSLKEHIDLFDAIEHSWFHHKLFNIPNKIAKKVAKKNNLPLVATSDTHHLDQMDKNYCILEAEEKSIEGVLNALQNRNIKNVTNPASMTMEMIPYLIHAAKEYITPPTKEKTAPEVIRDRSN